VLRALLAHRVDAELRRDVRERGVAEVEPDTRREAAQRGRQVRDHGLVAQELDVERAPCAPVLACVARPVGGEALELRLHVLGGRRRAVRVVAAHERRRDEVRHRHQRVARVAHHAEHAREARVHVPAALAQVRVRPHVTALRDVAVEVVDRLDVLHLDLPVDSLVLDQDLVDVELVDREVRPRAAQPLDRMSLHEAVLGPGGAEQRIEGLPQEVTAGLDEADVQHRHRQAAELRRGARRCDFDRHRSEHRLPAGRVLSGRWQAAVGTAAVKSHRRARRCRTPRSGGE
jgi:hypothetical protein